MGWVQKGNIVADKFRVGQKVRLIKSGRYPHLAGAICTVIRPQVWHHNVILNESWLGYTVDIEILNGKLCPAEDYLEPIYDGDEKSSWSECAWKPQTELQPISTITK
jgi:hypothetical protein